MNRPSTSTMARCANTGSSAGGCGSRLSVVSPKTIGCTRPKMAANATPSASSRIGVAHGCCCIAVVRIRNSLANTPNGGMPRIASEPSISPQPIVGLSGDQAADVLHQLRARLLRGVADGEEDRRLGQRVHGHVQQRGEVRHRPAHAERERDDAHVLDGRVREQALDVALSPEEERREHHREQAEPHQHVATAESDCSEPSTSTLQRTTA